MDQNHAQIQKENEKRRSEEMKEEIRKAVSLFTEMVKLSAGGFEVWRKFLSLERFCAGRKIF